MLTTTQMTTLAAAIKANPDCAPWLPTRIDSAIADYYNVLSTSDAWASSVSQGALFEETNIAKFDNLTAGKRDAWRMMLDFAPVDFTRGKVRKGVQDIWGDADSVAVLQACTRKATRAEVVLGGSSATTNTVTALKLNWEGVLSVNDVSQALNANP